jgi:hypothetical protein
VINSFRRCDNLLFDVVIIRFSTFWSTKKTISTFWSSTWFSEFFLVFDVLIFVVLTISHFHCIASGIIRHAKTKKMLRKCEFVPSHNCRQNIVLINVNIALHNSHLTIITSIVSLSSSFSYSEMCYHNCAWKLVFLKVFGLEIECSSFQYAINHYFSLLRFFWGDVII